ncbi:MAG: XkdX family protein [Clostridia bacterium]
MFEILKERYDLGFCTKPQLKRYVALGKLTAAEYKQFCGEVYAG